MKTFLIVCLAALTAASPAPDAEPAADAEANPEADPWFAYSGLHHYPLAYNGLHNTVSYNGLRNNVAYNGLYRPLSYGLGYPYAYPVVKKDEEKTDEAEVEPAEAAVPFTYGAGYPYAHYPYNYNYVHHSIGKREAEPAADAEANPEADPWVAYSGLHNYPLAYNGLHNTVAYNGLHNTVAYNGLYRPLSYGLGYPYAYPVVKKDEEKTDEAEVEPAEAAVPFTYGAGYPYAHYPYNYNYVHHSIGKRDAEATPEADPWTHYSSYYNRAYPYYNTYNGLHHYGARPAYAYGARPAYTYGARPFYGR